MIRTIAAAIPAVVARLLPMPETVPLSVYERWRDGADEVMKKLAKERDAAITRAEKAEAELARVKASPAAYPWSDEAVEMAYKAFCVHDGSTFDGMRAALATLTPPPVQAPVQAAPAPTVGDVWGKEAVRVVEVRNEGIHGLHLGQQLLGVYTSADAAADAANRIRRGLTSLPPLCAVLVGGVTEGMVEAYGSAFDAEYRVGGLEHERVRRGRVAGLTAALAAANIRVLGTNEVVARLLPDSESPSSGHIQWARGGSILLRGHLHDFVDGVSTYSYFVLEVDKAAVAAFLAFLAKRRHRRVDGKGGGG